MIGKEKWAWGWGEKTEGLVEIACKFAQSNVIGFHCLSIRNAMDEPVKPRKQSIDTLQYC